MMTRTVSAALMNTTQMTINKKKSEVFKMHKSISNNKSRSTAEYEVFKAAKSYMHAITDRLFRDNIIDYRNCTDCPDADGCEERQNIKELYDEFMKEMKPYAEMVAVSLTHAEFCRMREKRKGELSDTGSFTY